MRNFLWSKYKDRFVIFANVDWRGDGMEDTGPGKLGHAIVRVLQNEPQSQLKPRPLRSGVSGLKLFKRFGLEYREPGWLADQSG